MYRTAIDVTTLALNSSAVLNQPVCRGANLAAQTLR
jgi:hypothetical protein